jgi:hypothetical protein
MRLDDFGHYCAIDPAALGRLALLLEEAVAELGRHRATVATAADSAGAATDAPARLGSVANAAGEEPPRLRRRLAIVSGAIVDPRRPLRLVPPSPWPTSEAARIAGSDLAATMVTAARADRTEDLAAARDELARHYADPDFAAGVVGRLATFGAGLQGGSVVLDDHRVTGNGEPRDSYLYGGRSGGRPPYCSVAEFFSLAATVAHLVQGKPSPDMVASLGLTVEEAMRKGVVAGVVPSEEAADLVLVLGGCLGQQEPIDEDPEAPSDQFYRELNNTWELGGCVTPDASGYLQAC